MSDISKVIQARRKQLKIKQKDVANQLDVSRQTVNFWEHGAYLPRIDKLNALLDILNLKLVAGEIIDVNTSKNGDSHAKDNA